jgi:hypothetical protein
MYVGYSFPPWLLVIPLYFSYDWSNWSSSSFSNTTFQNFQVISDIFFKLSTVHHHTKLCSKCSVLLFLSLNLSSFCSRKSLLLVECCFCHGNPGFNFMCCNCSRTGTQLLWYLRKWLFLWSKIHHVSSVIAALSFFLSLCVGQAIVAYVLYIVKCVSVMNSAVWILLPGFLSCSHIILISEILYQMNVVNYNICKCNWCFECMRKCVTAPAKT